MEQVLAIARGPEAARAVSHAAYVFKGLPPVETIDVITEPRRLAMMAAERIAPVVARQPIDFSLIE